MMGKPKNLTAGAVNWELVEQALAMSPVDRMLDGPRLFEFACSFTKAGIREQRPGASDEEVLDELRRRVALERRRKGI